MAAIVAIFFSSTLTSCDENWIPDYPPGGTNDSFYDNSLTGCYWELCQVNSSIVRPNEVNVLEFFRNGTGYYYYFDEGIPKRMYTDWWCEWSNNNVSKYQINISYGGDLPMTMNYWFTSDRYDDYLWIQWYSHYYGTTTYIYRAVNDLPRQF